MGLRHYPLIDALKNLEEPEFTASVNAQIALASASSLC